LLINADVVLTPDAPLWAAVLAGIPFAFTLDFNAGAIRCPAVAACSDKRGSAGAAAPFARRYGMFTESVL